MLLREPQQTAFNFNAQSSKRQIRVAVCNKLK